MRAMRAMMMLALLGLLGGCVDGPRYAYGERVTGFTFTPINPSVGVHPDTSVLADPGNPFADSAAGSETRWEIESSGDPVAAFYNWATLLALIPIGEHQYYAALNLHRIHDDGLASSDDLPRVRDLAVAGYQAVLDAFPGSVTFDPSGEIAYGLATPAYQGIVALGAAPRGGWSLVTTADGNTVAVKTSDPPPPVEEP